MVNDSHFVVARTAASPRMNLRASAWFEGFRFWRGSHLGKVGDMLPRRIEGIRARYCIAVRRAWAVGDVTSLLCLSRGSSRAESMHAAAGYLFLTSHVLLNFTSSNESLSRKKVSISVSEEFNMAVVMGTSPSLGLKRMYDPAALCGNPPLYSKLVHGSWSKV